MAFRPTPSWLESSPGLFLSAIKAGSDAGNEIARLGQAQRDNEARRAIAMAELASQEGLAGERIRQAKELAEMENATRLQIEGQRGQRQDRDMVQDEAYRRDRLGLDRQEASNLDRFRQEQNAIREAGVEAAGARGPNLAQSALERDIARAAADAAKLTAIAKSLNADKLADMTLKQKANSAAAGAVARARSLQARGQTDAPPEAMVVESEEAASAPGGSQNPARPFATFKDGKFVRTR